MSKYTLTFKQNDIFIEFITTNREFTNIEMEKWVKRISELVNLPTTETPTELSKNSVTPPPNSEKSKKAEESKPKNVTKKTKFNKVFEENITKQISTHEVINPEKKAFKDILEKKKPDIAIDYLIIAAYYLNEFENIERYSLKQLNNLIVKNNEKPIDHSVIHEAVSKNLITVVPDYTGMADVTEYKLTSNGEEYYNNEL